VIFFSLHVYSLWSTAGYHSANGKDLSLRPVGVPRMDTMNTTANSRSALIAVEIHEIKRTP
jgi:hypothetical protein